VRRGETHHTNDSPRVLEDNCAFGLKLNPDPVGLRGPSAQGEKGSSGGKGKLRQGVVLPHPLLGPGLDSLLCQGVWQHCPAQAELLPSFCWARPSRELSFGLIFGFSQGDGGALGRGGPSLGLTISADADVTDAVCPPLPCPAASPSAFGIGRGRELEAGQGRGSLWRPSPGPDPN